MEKEPTIYLGGNMEEEKTGPDKGLEKQKKELIEKAIKIYGKISPCLNKPNLDECFTIIPEKGLVLWFNTEDHSTHMVNI